MEFKPTIPVFDRAATVMGIFLPYYANRDYLDASKQYNNKN
jgi:hypothetical protein